MARVPQDTGEERLIPEAEVLDGLRAGGAQIVRADQLGLVPDFAPPRSAARRGGGGARRRAHAADPPPRRPQRGARRQARLTPRSLQSPRMGLFKRRARGGTALAEPPATIEGLRAEIERLTEANRSGRDREIERRLLALRHLAGVRLTESDAAAEYPAADYAGLPNGGGLPEFAPGELTPELLRAGILRDGCVLVRGLVDREAALALAAQIDRVFAARAAFEAGSRSARRLLRGVRSARDALPGRLRAAVDPRRRRRAGRRLADGGLRDARAVRGRRA